MANLHLACRARRLPVRIQARTCWHLARMELGGRFAVRGGSPSTESRLAAPETYRSDAENSYPLHWKPSEMHGRPPEVHRQTPLAHGKPSRPHC